MLTDCLFVVVVASSVSVAVAAVCTQCCFSAAFLLVQQFYRLENDIFHIRVFSIIPSASIISQR